MKEHRAQENHSPRTLLSEQRLRIAAASLITMGLVACGSGSTPTNPTPPAAPAQSSAAIWFHPLPANAAWPGGNINGGSSDLLSVFHANAPWPRAMARTQVIGVYASWLTSITDDELQSFIGFLNAHDMSIEIEAASLQATASCGTGVEGYVPYGKSIHDFTLSYLQRLKTNGFVSNNSANGPQLIIKVDEPFFFGSVVGDSRSCHFSVTQVATEVGQYVQLVQTIYPNAIVGDVEPVVGNAYTPDIVTALGQWHDTYKQVTGAAFPFYFADIDFSNPAWPTLVKQLQDQTRQSGMKFGIIYIGDPTDTSDAVWAGKVVARFNAYQVNGPASGSSHPDYVLFQSWEPHPSLCLPETDATAFTGVLDAYLDAVQ